MEAVILAGGLGTRLRGVIGEIPKCMAPVDGKPFLQYQLEWLSRFDVRHVVFSVGYLREQVMDFVKSREWPFAITFAVEKEPLGTGGGIRLALQKCKGKQVFVLNGDTFYNVDLNTLSFTAPVTQTALCRRPHQRRCLCHRPFPTGYVPVPEDILV